MRGQIWGFHDSELIVSIYISPHTPLSKNTTLTFTFAYKVAFISPTYNIIILSMYFSFTMTEVSTVVVYVIFKFNNIMVSVLHVMPLQTPQAEMHVTPFYMQLHYRLLQSS